MLAILTTPSSAVLENLASQQSISEKIAQQTPVMSWLLGRIKIRESPVTQNKQYAAEVLAILLQSSVMNRKRLVEIDGVDALLQLVSSYRKRDPSKGTEEEEFVENVFDCLTCVVNEAEGKHKFVEAEGVELCLIMLREGKMSKPRALRLLDHAVGGSDGIEVCEKLVDAAGLKTVFSMFMKKVSKSVARPNLSDLLNSRTIKRLSICLEFSPRFCALCQPTPLGGLGHWQNLLRKTTRSW